MHFLDKNGWFALKSRRSFIFSTLKPSQWGLLGSTRTLPVTFQSWHGGVQHWRHHCSASLLIFVSSAHVGSVCLCACRLAALIHVHHPRRRSKPVPKSLRRISLSLPPLSLAYGPRSPGFNILTGLRLRNNKLIGLPKVYALVEVTLTLS